MIVSRCVQLSRLSNSLRPSILQNLKNRSACIMEKRHAGGHSFLYRQSPSEEISTKSAEILGGIFWWWIFWHIFTEYHELIPQLSPDAGKLSDEELGIPPL